MLAEFKLIGFIGKVSIPEKYNDRDVVFLSVITSNVYNEKYYTQWLNNISVWGNRARYIKEKAKPGQLWYLAGDLKVVKRKTKEEVMFNVKTYRMVRENFDEQIEKLQKREMDKFQAEMHAYDDYEEEELYDSEAYEQAKKLKGKKKKEE